MGAASPPTHPQSAEELWERLLPFVCERIELASSLDPISETYQKMPVEVAHTEFLIQLKRKRDFHTWVRKDKNWRKWAHRLTPLHRMSVEALRRIWDKLYNPKDPRYPVHVAVRKVYRKHRPEHYEPDEFFKE